MTRQEDCLLTLAGNSCTVATMEPKQRAKGAIESSILSNLYELGAALRDQGFTRDEIVRDVANGRALALDVVEGVKTGGKLRTDGITAYGLQLTQLMLLEVVCGGTEFDRIANEAEAVFIGGAC